MIQCGSTNFMPTSMDNAKKKKKKKSNINNMDYNNINQTSRHSQLTQTSTNLISTQTKPLINTISQSQNPITLNNSLTLTLQKNSQHITAGNLSIPKIYQITLQRNSLVFFYESFSSPHVDGTMGKSHNNK